MMLPDPGIVVIEAVSRVADPGVTESDLIRWVGVAVAVAGAVLATPDGIAAAWRWLRGRYGKTLAFGSRLLRRPVSANVKVSGVAGATAMSGTGYVDQWVEWRQDAAGDEKIDILHRQIGVVREQIGELRTQIERTADDLRREGREADDRIITQLRQLASEMEGERSQASRVDARGLGPIVLGIVMTGLADELATVPVVGWLVIVAAGAWTASVFPGWLRDYRQALKYGNG
jgi:hypothetical protein